MNIVADFLTMSARRYPDQVALVDGDIRFTYAELERMTNRVANILLGLGVNVGDAVSYHANNRWECVVVLCAAVRIGAITVPLNVMYTPSEMVPIATETGVKVIFTTQANRAAVEALLGTVPGLRHVVAFDDPEGFLRLLSQAGETFQPLDMPPTSPVTIFYTSGMTGQAKGAAQTHAFILHLAHSSVIGCAYTAADTFLVTTPMFWAAAPLHCILPVMLVGGKLVLMERFETGRCLDLVEAHGVTSMLAVPTMYIMLLEEQRERLQRLDHLRVCTTAGSPIGSNVVEAFENLTGSPLLNIYGSTEAAVISRELLGVPRKMGSAGTLGGTVSVRLVDPNGHDTPRGEPGEILCRGLTVIDGYWRQPEATAAAFHDGWFATGDIGVLDDDGYLFIVDRKKEVIITGGANIYPAEVEQVLLRHPQVLLCAVIGLPDRVRGEISVAYVLPRPGARPGANEMATFCRTALAAYKVPRRFVLCSELPLTATGKVFKRKLREQALETGEDGGRP